MKKEICAYCGAERNNMKTTREYLLQLHDNMTAKAKKIMEVKNSDYGANQDALHNFRLCEQLYIPMEIGILTRLCDKIARIGNLINKPNRVLDETIQDTIIDTINYMIILNAALEERKEKEKEAK